MAALLDEVMGAAAWATGRMVVAASMTLDYRQMLPIPQRCLVEARVERVEGRKVWTRAKLTDLSRSRLYSQSEGLFLDMGAGVYEALGGEALRAAAESGTNSFLNRSWGSVSWRRRIPEGL